MIFPMRAPGLEAQLSMPPTLLRSHYRAKPAGVPRTSCEPGSRWLQVTFTAADVGARVVANGAQIFVAGAGLHWMQPTQRIRSHLRCRALPSAVIGGNGILIGPARTKSDDGLAAGMSHGPSTSPVSRNASMVSTATMVMMLLDCQVASCTATSLQASDVTLLSNALSTRTGGLRDVNCQSVPAGAVVQVSSDTFQHVHIHEGNVYDFTEWVSAHPGGSSAITKWGSNGYKLQYPGNHPMDRFETQVKSNVLQYVGKEDSEVRYLDLPTNLKTEALALELASTSSQNLSLACPSPGEVADNPQLGNNMPFYYRCIDFSDLRNDMDFDHPSEYQHRGRHGCPGPVPG